MRSNGFFLTKYGSHNTEQVLHQELLAPESSRLLQELAHANMRRKPGRNKPLLALLPPVRVPITVIFDFEVIAVFEVTGQLETIFLYILAKFHRKANLLAKAPQA